MVSELHEKILHPVGHETMLGVANNGAHDIRLHQTSNDASSIGSPAHDVTPHFKPYSKCKQNQFYSLGENWKLILILVLLQFSSNNIKPRGRFRNKGKIMNDSFEFSL